MKNHFKTLDTFFILVKLHLQKKSLDMSMGRKSILETNQVQIEESY